VDLGVALDGRLTRASGRASGCREPLGQVGDRPVHALGDLGEVLLVARD